MFDMFGGYNQNKLKPQLKMAVHRFQMASNKKSALLKQSTRAVAVLLAEDPPKEEKARIKAEALIRDDYMIEAYDILSLNCELLSERIKLISFQKECPPDLVSCIATLIYAAPRVDIPELLEIKKQFRAKYGKKFEEDAMNNVGGVLNERVVTKLSVQPPAAFLVQTYLEKSCEQHNVKWSPTVKLTAAEMGEPMAPPVGFSVPTAQGTGLGPTMATTGTSVAGEELTYDSGTQPNSQPLPDPYKPPMQGGGATAPKDDFAEPDIFIPAAPGQSHVSSKASSNGTAPSAPSAPPAENTKGDDDNDDTTGQPPSSGGGQTSSYRDLAARFDSLKKS